MNNSSSCLIFHRENSLISIDVTMIVWKLSSSNTKQAIHRWMTSASRIVLEHIACIFISNDFFQSRSTENSWNLSWKKKRTISFATDGASYFSSKLRIAVKKSNDAIQKKKKNLSSPSVLPVCLRHNTDFPVSLIRLAFRPHITFTKCPWAIYVFSYFLFRFSILHPRSMYTIHGTLVSGLIF